MQSLPDGAQPLVRSMDWPTQPVSVYPSAPPFLPAANWCFQAGFEAGSRSTPQMKDADTQTPLRHLQNGSRATSIKEVAKMTNAKAQQGSIRVFDATSRGYAEFDAVEGASFRAA